MKNIPKPASDSCTAKNRTKCEIWTRVMGYHRPVASFNIGKKAEHKERKHFSEIAMANSRICQKYKSL